MAVYEYTDCGGQCKNSLYIKDVCDLSARYYFMKKNPIKINKKISSNDML